MKKTHAEAENCKIFILAAMVSYLFESLILVSVCNSALFESREKLLSLLHEIDSSGKAQLPEVAGSLLQSTIMSSTDIVLSPESPRRRGGHPPCECPDTPGDSSAAACLNRRLELIYSDLSSLQSPNRTTGFSIEGGRMALRTAYENAISASGGLDRVAQLLFSNLSEPINGYVAREGRITGKALNEETLLVESVNNAWMSLVNVSKGVDSGASSFASLMYNSTEDLISWFNRMQFSEESSNYANLLKTESLAGSSLKVYVDSLNRAGKSVFDGIGNLSKGLDSDSSSMEGLLESMVSSGDYLERQLRAFNQSLANIGDPTKAAIQQSLTNWVQEYEGVGQQRISAFRSGSEGKLGAMLNSSKILISQQSNSATASLGNTRANLMALVAPVVNSQASLVDKIHNTLQNLSGVIATANQQKSSSFQAKASLMDGNVSVISQREDSLGSQLDSFNRSERSLVNSKIVQDQALLSSARKTTLGLQGTAQTKLGQTLALGSTESAATVSAVGSGYQEQLSRLGADTRKLISQLVHDAGQAAQTSASALGGLSVSVLHGSQAVRSAKTTVSREMQGSLTDLLTKLATLPKRIGVPDSLNQYVTEAAANHSAQLANVSVAASSGLVLSAGNASKSEASIAAFLERIDRNESASHSRIDRIQSSVRGHVQVMAGAKTLRDPKWSKRALSDAAMQIARSEDRSASTLSNFSARLMNRAGKPRGGVFPLNRNLVTSLTSARDLVSSAKRSSNTALSQTKSQAKAALAALEGAHSTSRSASKKAWSAYRQSSDRVGASRAGSVSTVHKMASSSISRVSSTVQDQLKKIDYVKKQSVIKTNQLGVRKLDQAQTLSSSIQGLAEHVNEFLGEDSQPLAVQMKSLTGDAQRLLLQLKALEAQAASVQKAESRTSSWGDILQMTRTILSNHNSSAFDNLALVKSDFSHSADNASVNWRAAVMDTQSAFITAANSLESQLSSVSGVSRSAMASGASSSGSTIATQIGYLNSAMNITANNFSAIASRFANSSSLPASNPLITSLVSKVAKASALAAAQAANASSVVDRLAVKASAQISAINSFNQSSSSLINPSDVIQQASLATMTESIANANLIRNQTLMRNISGSVSNLSSDYREQVQSQTAALGQNSSALFDRVVVGKAQVSDMVATVAANYAAKTANISAYAQAATNQQSINLALMRSRLMGLIRAFDGYISAANSSFDTGRADMSSFSVGKLAYLQRTLGAFAQSLVQSKQDLISNVSQINSTLQSLNNSLIDSKIDSTRDQFNDWFGIRQSNIRDTNATLQTLTKQMPINSTTILQKLSSAVYSAASTAQTLLRQFSVNNTKINAYVSAARKNMTLANR